MNKPESNPIQIRDISQIDLDAHGVVEASAGTGKTYTIEHLVVELLKSGKVQSLNQILVVTFTEKAVGELKNRIRNIIRLSLEKEPSEILNASYENFDSASIYTIHGFCNKIINDYVFENRRHISSTLVDDRTVYEHVLARIKRDNWPVEYGDQLNTVLQLSGYPGSTGTGTSSWEDLVIDIALRYQQSGFDIIHPQAEPDLVKKIQSIQKKSSVFLDALIPLVGAIDETDYAKSDLCIKYDCLNINKRSRQGRIPLLIDLLQLVSSHARHTLSIKQLADFIDFHGCGNTGFNELNSKWNKPGPDFEATLPNLPEIIRILENLRALDFSELRFMLSVKTIHELKNYGIQYKTGSNLISYDDMIVHVFSILQDQSSILINLLRERYTYALVDEFQDTDMLQWAIFKSIFLESEKNRLFIIGDPKQAIYGFRGADIHAYLLARDEMISSYNARFYSLTENWRSSPSLIRVFNSVFGNTNWFNDGTIGYIPSSFPEKKNPGLHSDDTSLILVDCGSTSGTDARLRFSDYIACEINSLMSSNYPFKLDDIAILVTKWREADIIEKSLKQASIKYSFYKKEGLYQTKESLELYCLLSAIANPHDIAKRKIAFATRFYNIDKQSLHHIDNVTVDHPAYTLFNKWVLLADEKNWAQLFQSILEETGILYRIGKDDHDRQILNYKAIIQALEIEAYCNNFCIHEVAVHHKKLMSNISTSNDTSNIQLLDIDQPGVQILTMHASKGLEFKIVFIGGGFTKRDMSPFLIYHIKNKRIFNLIRNDSNRYLHDLERSHEEDRLFYVAMTRACDRLYIPFFEPSKSSSAGLIGNKIPRALQVIRDDPATTLVSYEHIQRAGGTIKQSLKKQSSVITLPEPLFPDSRIDFIRRTIAVDSFSGIKTKLHGSAAHNFSNAEFGPDSRQSDENSMYTQQPDDANIKLTEGIPHGIETGLMLHDILETIDFQKIRLFKEPDDILKENSIFDTIIDSAIKNNFKKRYDDIASMKHDIAFIIWNIFHAPLDTSGFTLCDIDNKINEVEFYYSTRNKIVPDDEVSISPSGYIHGFIDMIFEYHDKYYLVDWKSNYIEEGYTFALIEKNIKDMHYDLQINIYTEALIRWLRRFKTNFNYEQHFGGVYYLYLRGLHPSKPGDGVYFYRPPIESVPE